MIGNVLLTLVTRVAVVAAGILTSILTAHSLGVVGRGEYFSVVTLANLAVQFGNLGLAASNTYSLAQDHTLLARLAANSLWISIVAGLTSAVVVFFLENQGVTGDHPHGAIRVVVVMVPTMLYGLLASNLLIGLSHIRQYNLFLLGSNFLRLLGLLLAVHYSLGVVGFLLVSAATSLVSSCVLFYMLRMVMGHTWKFDYPLFRSSVGFAARAYTVAFLGFCVSRGGVLMLGHYSGVGSVGLYSIALQFFDVLMIVPSTVAMILFPDLLRGRREDRFPRTLKALRNITATMIAMCVVTALAGHWVVPVMFGTAFQPAIPILYWMLPGVIALSTANIMSQYLAADGIPLENILAWGASLALLLVGCVELVPTLGGRGAAIALSLAYCLLAFLIAGIAFRRVRSPGWPSKTVIEG